MPRRLTIAFPRLFPSPKLPSRCSVLLVVCGLGLFTTASSVSAAPAPKAAPPKAAPPVIGPTDMTPGYIAGEAIKAEPPDDMAPAVLKAIKAVNALLRQYPNRETVVEPGLHETWRYIFVPLRGNKMLLISYETSLCLQEGKPPVETVETLVETLPLNKFTEEGLFRIQGPTSYNHRNVRSIYVNHDSNMAELWKNKKENESITVPPVVAGHLTMYQKSSAGEERTTKDTLRPGFYLHFDDTTRIEEIEAAIRRIFETANPSKNKAQ